MTTESLRGTGVEHSPQQWVSDSTPYPWPYDGVIEADSLALIIVLPQVPVPGIRADIGERAMSNVLALTEAVEDFGGAVVRMLTPGPISRGASVGGDSWSPPTDAYLGTTITAGGLDGFFGSTLDADLRKAGRTHLLLAGAPLETAVHSTMRAANDQGYECLLIEDACAALDPDLKRNSLSMVEMSGGIFGAIGTTAHTIAALTVNTSEVP